MRTTCPAPLQSSRSTCTSMPINLDFGAKAAAYVDQVMANLNWERIGARYRLAIGEAAEEDELFLPFGAPAQEEARISAEELKLALECDDNRRPVLLDLCLPRDL